MKNVKVYYRIKCSLNSQTAGVNHISISKTTGETMKHYISIFIPRIWFHANLWGIRNTSCNNTQETLTATQNRWNDLFSEVVSHEVIHKTIYQLEGLKATCALDNLFGVIPRDAKCGDGLGKGNCF